MDVGLHTANHVVVLDKPPARGLLEDVKNHLALAETVEEGSKRTHVHHKARIEKQVRSHALQLVHDGTDILCAFRNLDARRPLDTHAQRVAVLVRAQVVQPVRESQRLWISQAFAQLLNAAMDITQHGIDFLHRLAVERGAQAQGTVRRRMLRPDVHHEVIRVEHHVLPPFQCAVGHQPKFFRHVGILFISHVQRIAVHVVILAQGVTFPILAQEKAAHIGIAREEDAQEIIRLALLDFRRLPQSAHGRQHRPPLPLHSIGAEHDTAARAAALQLVISAQASFALIDPHEVAQVVHRFLRIVVQPAAHVLQPVGRHVYDRLARRLRFGLRAPLLDFFFCRHAFSSRFVSPSSGFSLRLRPPRKRSILILRCSCIMP